MREKKFSITAFETRQCFILSNKSKKILHYGRGSLLVSHHNMDICR